MSTWYHVWRRSPDGYVNASANSAPTISFTGMLGTLGGQPVDFEILLSTQNWEQARERIEQERAADALTRMDQDMEESGS
jgi:hypothetical protein